jgi:hypothetical protein
MIDIVDDLTPGLYLCLLGSTLEYVPDIPFKVTLASNPKESFQYITRSTPFKGIWCLIPVEKTKVPIKVRKVIIHLNLILNTNRIKVVVKELPSDNFLLEFTSSLFTQDSNGFTITSPMYDWKD